MMRNRLLGICALVLAITEITLAAATPTAKIPDSALGPPINELRGESLKTPVRSLTLFGMELIDVNAELQKLYHLSGRGGVLILDPGPNVKRLDIDDPGEGCRIWLVGNKRVANLAQCISELQRIAAIPPPKDGGMIDEGNRDMIRVVFNYTPESRGTNTQYLALTPEDREQLFALTEPKASSPELSIAREFLIALKAANFDHALKLMANRSGTTVDGKRIVLKESEELRYRKEDLERLVDSFSFADAHLGEGLLSTTSAAVVTTRTLPHLQDAVGARWGLILTKQPDNSWRVTDIDLLPEAQPTSVRAFLDRFRKQYPDCKPLDLPK